MNQPAAPPASGRIPPAALAAVLALAALIRLPLLGNGFGSDDDPWRNAVTAIHSLEAGRYIPSRAPGFPLFEGLMMLLVPLGPVAAVGAAALASLVCVTLFARLLESYRVPAPLLPLVAFAFGPPLAVLAVQAMDHGFALMFFLGAWLAARRGHDGRAGVMMALATGCRPTYALIHLAFAARLWLSGAPRERWLRFAAGAIPLTVALFVPVLLAPETRHLEGHLGRHVAEAHVTLATAPEVARKAALFLFGHLGTPLLALGVAFAALARMRRPAEPGAQPNPRADQAFAWLLVLAVGGFWLLIPYVALYLLPLLPLALIAAVRALPRPWAIAVTAAIAFETFAGVQFRPPRLLPGAIAAERAARRTALDQTARQAAFATERPTVRVVGREAIHRLLVLHPELERLAPAWEPFWGPGVALRSRDGRRAFAATLEPQQRATLERAGWRVESGPEP